MPLLIFQSPMIRGVQVKHPEEALHCDMLCDHRKITNQSSLKEKEQGKGSLAQPLQMPYLPHISVLM
jgi:hypothetical protein